MDYSNLRKQREYIDALIVAHDAVEEGKALDTEKPNAEPVDVAAQKISASNIAIAGSGVKAELMGTLEDEPTITEKTLVDVGFDEKQAVDMVAECVQIRAEAIDLRKPKAEPIGDVEPLEEIKP